MKKLLSVLFLASALMMVSCGKDDESSDDDGGTTNCNTTALTYTDDIKSIIDGGCAVSGCHSEAEAALQGSMHDYAGAKAFADSGRVLGSINHEDDFSPMPYPEGSAKLSQCTIDKLTAWINEGAPE